ncbi:hypothetical protein DBR19_07520 [Aeromonas sp. HMWF014]|nr:hypothetical protein DBR19_07520 [Aeromonas sp. HMWF014]
MSGWRERHGGCFDQTDADPGAPAGTCAAQGRAGRAHSLSEVICHFRDRITQINGMAQEQSKVTVEPFRC